MMKRSRILASMSVLCVAAMALAQSADFDAYASNIAILMDRTIQKELKVDEEQRGRLNKHAEWFNSGSEKMAKDFEAKRKENDEAKPPQAEAAKMEDEFKKRVLRELKSMQLKRLRELTLQATGPIVLLDERVAKQVKVSDSQLKKLRGAHEAGQAMVAAIEQRAFAPVLKKYKDLKPEGEAAQKKAAEALNKDMGRARQAAGPLLNLVGNSYGRVMQATLSDTQKKEFRALLGEPFKAPAAE